MEPTRNRIRRDEECQQDASKTDLRVIASLLPDPGAEIVEADERFIWMDPRRVVTGGCRIAEDHRLMRQPSLEPRRIAARHHPDQPG